MNKINGDYGVFVIRNYFSNPYFPVRCDARYHFTVHRSVEEAISYLVGRFGADVVYEVKAE